MHCSFLRIAEDPDQSNELRDLVVGGWETDNCITLRGIAQKLQNG